MDKVLNSSKNSVLQMKDLYFSMLEFNQSKKIGGKEISGLTVNYHIEIKGIDNDPASREIIFSVSLGNIEKTINAKVVANGYFSIESDELTDEEKENIFKYNAVAIMFPFIRSQISLLTTQPGITPVMLQPIDVNKLWDKE